MTSVNIDDGNFVLVGVENDDDNCFVIDGVNDDIVVVALAIKIDDGLETAMFTTSRFNDMFVFNDTIGVFCNLPSLFLGGGWVEVLV